MRSVRKLCSLSRGGGLNGAGLNTKGLEQTTNRSNIGDILSDAQDSYSYLTISYCVKDR